MRKGEKNERKSPPTGKLKAFAPILLIDGLTDFTELD